MPRPRARSFAISLTAPLTEQWDYEWVPDVAPSASGRPIHILSRQQRRECQRGKFAERNTGRSLPIGNGQSALASVELLP